jgi:transcriptional regulator with XRE-family HTH domain
MARMKDYRKVFGQNVRAARKTLGLSQEALAAEVGLDRTYISGIERGVRNPSLDVIVRIAQRLNVQPGQLLT